MSEPIAKASSVADRIILVTGSVTARPGNFDDALRLSTEHVSRSRTEPGCLAHAVYRDTENPDRLVFVEQWESMDALRAHFAVPDTRDFAKALAALSAGAPDLQIYDATERKP